MTDVGRARRPWSLGRVDIGGFAPFAALAVLALLGGLVNPRFLGFDNLANVITRSAFIATIAVGQTLVITAGGWTYPSARWRRS